MSDSKSESGATTVISKALQPRLFFVDNLRVFLIVLVLLVHMAITYGSPLGSWYYQEGVLGMPTAAVYVVFLGLCQAFFMGLLFLLSGYFTAPAYDKKGGHNFLKDRLIRLGVPMVIFIGLVEPAVDYVVTQVNGTFHGSFLTYYSTYIFFGYGILWFILALLLFAFRTQVGDAFSPSQLRLTYFPKT